MVQSSWADHDMMIERLRQAFALAEQRSEQEQQMLADLLLAEMQAEAAKDAWCWVRVLEATDHPILLPVPETLHQRCFILVIRY